LPVGVGRGSRSLTTAAWTTRSFALSPNDIAVRVVASGADMATYKPGEKAPDSGELIEVGPRGGKVEDGRRVVIERG
jgi:hypothetical protein